MFVFLSGRIWGGIFSWRVWNRVRSRLMQLAWLNKSSITTYFVGRDRLQGRNNIENIYLFSSFFQCGVKEWLWKVSVFIEGMEDGFHRCHFGFAPAHGYVFQAPQQCLGVGSEGPTTNNLSLEISEKIHNNLFVHLQLSLVAWDYSGPVVEVRRVELELMWE